MDGSLGGSYGAFRQRRPAEVAVPAADDVAVVGTASLLECSRCHKQFVQTAARCYKLCPHCRQLQRERLRRWQQRTKERSDVCHRCGGGLAAQDAGFALCARCRNLLRLLKALRPAQGRCLHCSQTKDPESAGFLVCLRCRTNDRNRRSQLEQQGVCNRCGALLEGPEHHKVCTRCRERKKRSSGRRPVVPLDPSPPPPDMSALAAAQAQAQQLMAAAQMAHTHILPQQVHLYLLLDSHMENDNLFMSEGEHGEM